MTGRLPLLAWLPDVAANLLGLLIVLLLALAAAPNAGGQMLIPHRRAPLSGPEMIEALRLRLVAPDGQAQADLTAGGLRELAPGAVGPAMVFVLDGTDARALSDRFGQTGWQQMSVPAALLKDGAWSPYFLSLAALAETPGRFRSALARLLRRGPGGSLWEAPERPASIADRLAGFLDGTRWAVNLCLWLATLGFTLRLARRVRA
jgi:hypothetical protein